MPQEINIVIGGEAGQGLVTIGQLLSKVLVRAGCEIFISQSYHSRIRGGHNTFAIRTGTIPFHAPRQAIDLLVALNEESVALHQSELAAGGLIIADAAFAPDAAAAVAVPFAELGPEKFWNTAALGLIGSILGLPADLLFQAIEELLGAKHPETLAANREVLDRSCQWAAERIKGHHFKLADSRAAAERLMLNGNEAIALGALAGGLKFCAFYPMTPATSIVLNLIAHADAMGCVVEQAEDEIAAINMAIGASFAGAPSMVATSGGGFALMTEGVSLAGMTETPLLIVIAQRPGPATGLPTRTEQGDLGFVLHSGHGEFPRALFAPGDLESCYALTQRALALAERCQTPVFLLTDQFLADSSRAIAPFDPENIAPVRAGADPGSMTAPYRRYAVTESGISPRLLPGVSEHLVVADSDEHDEEGHITEEQPVRIAMVDKRLRKFAGLRQEVLPPHHEGPADADLLLVGWGSTRGPLREAAEILANQGRRVATLHFTQIWPLVPEQFRDLLATAGTVVCVEGNATGQFARLIRQESGFSIPHQVLRYDGLPFTARYILDRLDHLMPKGAQP
ncbi:MAG: 2-oxoacid:acceptor oxidoreductase subunit alpha [Thermodesulfobacteriota bacterium]